MLKFLKEEPINIHYYVKKIGLRRKIWNRTPNITAMPAAMFLTGV
jgi:hypothetical protein